MSRDKTRKHEYILAWMDYKTNVLFLQGGGTTGLNHAGQPILESADYEPRILLSMKEAEFPLDLDYLNLTQRQLNSVRIGRKKDCELQFFVR